MKNNGHQTTNNIRKSVFKYIVGVFSVVCCLLFVVPAHAQSDFSITAYPAIIDQTVEPNQQTRLLLQFKNNTSSAVTGQVKIANYTINNKFGDPIIIDDPSMKVKYAAASWITPDQEQITIPANNYVAINLMVRTPSDISTCGNYALAYFQYDEGAQPGVSSGKKSASSLSAKVGALINLTKKSKSCIENVTVARFETPSFLEFGPVPVSFDLLNMGDMHEAPVGKIILKNMFNGVVGSQALKDQRIFPETAKTYTNSVGSKWLFGRFAVQLEAVYGPSNIPVVYTAYLWVIPWRLIIVILLALVILSIVFKNVAGKMQHKEEELESKLEKEEEEISQLKKMLREKKE